MGECKRTREKFFEYMNNNERKKIQDAVDQALHDKKKKHEAELKDARETASAFKKSESLALSTFEGL